ncbi:diaminopimelate epimerase [Aquihabitans sp. G128]|uniref:diaminopimelate epimerase n=1 Tax=Aquihabitans sp. G128 TaxID=2849779 RepID=UPI001C248366|nr:diaminopimelate epimerase [Aquihabitans sp. G128]QXC62500.1 diaminopimelate epimerase [Aquihabitans sp. G128]
MTFSLTKHHGLGNDFLVFLTDDPVVAGERDAWVERAFSWCDRFRGIGADGLLIGLWGQPGVDLVMTLVNADGSLAEMSGNGIRCLAQAEALRRGEAEVDLAIQTDGGLRSVRLGPDPEGEPHRSVATVDMGPARPGPTKDRVPEVSEAEVEQRGASALGLDATRSATFDLGNPHLVLLVPDPVLVDVAVAGASHESVFADGMNVHFVAPTDGEADAMDMKVWERGAGVTEACGTGATAVARAAYDWGLVGSPVTVHMPGGDVVVEVGDTMVLHGPTVFIGEVEVPEALNLELDQRRAPEGVSA